MFNNPLKALNQLMFKVTNICKYHGNARCVSRFDGLFIANRATWLNNSCDAMLCRCFYGIAKREECIGCQYSAFCGFPGLLKGNFCRAYAIHLTGPNSKGTFFIRNQNSIGLYMFYKFPCKFKSFPLFLCWLYLRNNFIIGAVF